jgi:hypothetical protein
MDDGPASGYSLGSVIPAFAGVWRRFATPSHVHLAMDDNLKAPLVVFNLTLGLYMLIRLFTAAKVMTFGTMFVHLLIGAAIGLVLGGITFAVLRKK